jgi:hypothetical protein
MVLQKNERTRAVRKLSPSDAALHMRDVKEDGCPMFKIKIEGMVDLFIKTDNIIVEESTGTFTMVDPH